MRDFREIQLHQDEAPLPVRPGILSTIGRTPLVELEHYLRSQRLPCRIVAVDAVGSVIFAGPDAVEKLQDQVPAGSCCVAILPDRGERYLDTVYNETWVQEHLCRSADACEADSNSRLAMEH